MGHQNDGMSLVGQFAQQEHHLAVQARIEARCWFIQEEDAGVGEQFECDGDTFALSTRQFADEQFAPELHFYVVEHFIDTLVYLFLGEVIGEAHAGGVIQGAFNG